jgi:uncharacterized membrane protein YbhN (UPF0104 family)
VEGRRRQLPRALRVVQNLVGTAVLVGFVYYLVTHSSEAGELLEASAFDVGVLTLLVLVTMTLNLVQNFALVRRLGVDLRWGECFLLTFATNFGNYLPMRAGTLIVAHYLKSVHALPYARYSGLFGIRLLITLFGTGLLGTFATLYIWAASGRLSLYLLAMFAALVVMTTLLWFFPLPPRREGSGRLRRILDDALLGASRLRSDPRLGLLVLSTIVLQQATLVARFHFGTRALGHAAPLGHLLLLSPVASLASLAAFTPGALGLREAAMGAATYAIGASFTSGMQVGTLDRSVLFGVVMLVGGICFPWVWLKIRSVERARPHEPAP